MCQAVGDADTLVVSAAISIALTRSVTVVADDTDILVMLIYHFKLEMFDMFMLSDMPQRRSRQVVFPILTLCLLHNKYVSQLLVIHAFSECDTTSALFGQRVLKVMANNAKAVQLNQPNVTKEELPESGLSLLAIIYNGQPNDNLTRLCYLSYMNKAATSTFQFRPECLPPTENAAKFHIFRVHFQLIQWIEL